jgi:CheY-like chemotaxis protein
VTKPKLLLADDSITIRKVVELTFADEGLEVMTASTGAEAMEKFFENRPDIVIADVNMPEPTGYQICETIKQNEATKHIPVLLVVGSFEPFDQAEAERVGADGFLTKPFQSIRDLINRVSALLGIDKQTAPPAETVDIDSLYDQSFEGPEVSPDVDLAIPSLVTEPAAQRITQPSIKEIKAATVGDTVEIPLGDAGMDDEIIEMSHPSADVHQLSAGSSAPAATPSAENGARSDSAVQPVAKNYTEQTAQNISEPSEEFINLVARRVIEKLSDKAVREIAKETVPQIAEKLIREALDEDKKRR